MKSPRTKPRQTADRLLELGRVWVLEKVALRHRWRMEKFWGVFYALIAHIPVTKARLSQQGKVRHRTWRACLHSLAPMLHSSLGIFDLSSGSHCVFILFVFRYIYYPLLETILGVLSLARIARMFT